MIGSFSFNGVQSSSFKLVCKSVNRSLLPAVKLRRIEVPGISGVYDLDANGVDYEYEMRTVTMLIQYIGTDYIELRTRARTIAAWLSTQGFAQLILNDESDKYYLAKVTSEINLEGLWESGSAEITFDCQPFAYAVTEQILSYPYISSLDEEFTNPGTRTITYKSPPGSRLHITIDGSWDTVSVGIGSETQGSATLLYTLPGSGVLTIDCIEMEAYLDSVNKFSALEGNVETFLRVFPGVNSLVIGGTNVDVSVTLRYIPLWL